MSAALDPPAEAPASFDALYEAHFDFVWRNLRRLGVPDSAVHDAAQEVFVVVFRRLREFEGRSSVRTWLAGIAIRVASDRRRQLKRKGGAVPLSEALPDPSPGPHEAATRSEARRIVYALLEQMDQEKREVFVLVELEQMTAPEIAEALGVKLNTVYSRLRLAREQFEEAITDWKRRAP